MPNVYVTRRIPQAGLDLLTDYCDKVDINPDDRVLTRDELLASVKGRDGVLCLLTDHIDEAVFAAAGPACRVFANYAVGYNNIDLDAARRHNIRITNTPGVLTDATADMAWALLFSAARRVVESDQYLRSGKWDGWGPMQMKNCARPESGEPRAIDRAPSEWVRPESRVRSSGNAGRMRSRTAGPSGPPWITSIRTESSGWLSMRTVRKNDPPSKTASSTYARKLLAVTGARSA